MPQRLLPLLLLLVPLIWVQPAVAAELKLDHLMLEPCSVTDPGNQPDFARPMGATCYVLSGEVENPGRKVVVDTDVFARIMDASGEPILPNRTRVGSIGDVDPGVQAFALRLSVPAGTPGPFEIRNPRARGFKAPVRNLAGLDDDDLLPLEQAIQ
ncbi:MAG: hypothetical protein CL863_06095 [Cyanobium sp. RS427]|jgi:hypothetical protein|nr:hypothetical protein [Cyanobium sp. RS427]|tara:strand:- start:1788 stop:2252 length:465 start_codon:yes stop_codon:yes gene_type:complete